MRNQISRRSTAFVLCVLALAAAACERAGTPGPAAQAPPPPNAAAPESRAAQARPGPAAAVPAAPSSRQVETQPGATGGAPPAGRAAELPETGQVNPVDQLNERRPQPPAVTVGQPAPAETRDLRSRERRLAAREATLSARERRLRQREEAGLPAAEPPAAPAAQAARPGPAEPSAGDAPAEPEERAPRAEPVTVAAGTTFEVEFAKGLASNTASVGDTFRARVVSDVLQDGVMAIPAGSEVLGAVMGATGVRGIGGQAKLALSFTDLVLPSGATVPIHASFLAQGKSKAGKDAATIGGATAGGAILGRILGQANRGKGTIIGAILGAAAGTAIASRSAGEEVVIPEGSVVHIQLTDPVDLAARR
jgi:type IV secretory pathway VirB10-like protein